jgi:DNA-binding transcriptional ArsR family regulator
MDNMGGHPQSSPRKDLTTGIIRCTIFVVLNVSGEFVVKGYSAQSELLKAMAHPVRLRILDILSQGEACVCHLTAVLKRRQPYVSQQLMTLREMGLVSDRRDGLMVYYSLADGRVETLLALTREMLRDSGALIDLALVPEPPVNGCPCPACEEAARRAA